ncbi:MAG: carbohydrate ABC transporter permease [Lachnospiraceae bacterium]|jgi:oligogalacturonide transport system permease protein|nr:carbohydrate ABC transporter permease [Lachnospiraceae bacterium]MCH4032255.1 carbohydrate ABC transporter permease [Lachnospiraceae bacterium]MCH4108867.1 carbohydrate ABC transporter permease [Lachnospiraceae bacterium]MCI1303148.1 carbohydrate ABC transporter permease [Lachnospiraceae bacterium]MCI1332665.1 carbohydrate ABC transporter permease [Lachnospiraceae bacterium]
MKKRTRGKVIAYIFLIVVGIVMVYPLVWLFFSCFKTNQELFASLTFLPEHFSLDGFINGWKGSGQFTYGTFYRNTFLQVIPTVVFTVISTGIVAYGFARFRFPLKKAFFLMMISTMMLPSSVITIPRYVLFNKFGWVDSYLPFWIPALLATYPFFIFMQIQFMRGIPKELDESAYVDGCNPFVTYVRIIFPLMKPAVFSVIIFQFLWRWNDYYNNLIYISSTRKYALPLALKMSIDTTGGVTEWCNVLSMSFLSMIPPTLLFFFAQKYFVEGITAGSVKG